MATPAGLPPLEELAAPEPATSPRLPPLEALAAPDVPAPTPKSPPLEDLAAPDENDTRSVSTDLRSLDRNTLVQGITDLHQAAYDEAKGNGSSDEDAQDIADRAVKGMDVAGREGASLGAVRDQLDANVGTDTASKILTRAFGTRLVPTPLEAPSQGERDEQWRNAERQNRAGIGGALARAWEGEEAPPTSVADARAAGIDKPWTQTAKDMAGDLAEDVLGGGLPVIADTVANLVGYDLPGAHSIQEKAKFVADYGGDRDVQAVTSPTGIAHEVIGTAARLTPLGEAVAGAAKATGLDHAELVQPVISVLDDATPRPKFDEAAKHAYDTGDASGLDALTYTDLPGRLRGTIPNASAVLTAATSGAFKDDPTFAPIRDAAGKAPAYLERQVELLPLGALRQIQPTSVPSDKDIEAAYKHRASMAEWRGDKEAGAVGRLMAAGLLTPNPNGDGVTFVPSRLAELMRIAGTGLEGVYEVNAGPTDLPELPGMRAARKALLDDGSPTSLYQKLEHLKIPFKAGLDFMAASGAYDDWMHAAGLEGSDKYAALRDPDSTWASRVLTNVALPDYEGNKLADVYERAGGNPQSGVDKALGVVGFAGDMLIPADEWALMPFAEAAKATNTARAASKLAGEVGLSARDARLAALAAAAPRLVGASDGIAAAHDVFVRATKDALESGRLNPAALPRRTWQQVAGLLGEAGVENPEKYVEDLRGKLADRHAQVLDANAKLSDTSGPATKALRDSAPYKKVAGQLDAAVTAGNLTPKERDATLRMLEVFAFKAAEDGKVGAPDEWFDQHDWAMGGVSGAGAFFQGEETPEIADRVHRIQRDTDAQYQRALTRLRTEDPEFAATVPQSVAGQGGALSVEIPYTHDELTNAAEASERAGKSSAAIDRFTQDVKQIQAAYEAPMGDIWAATRRENPLAGGPAPAIPTPTTRPRGLVIPASSMQPWAVRLREATRNLLDLYGTRGVDAEWISRDPSMFRNADPDRVRAAIAEYAQARDAAGLHPGDPVSIEGIDPMPEPVRSATEGANRPLFQKVGGGIRGSIEPAATKWLIRLFKTADIQTAFHEGAHLLRFIMGDDWSAKLSQFFDHTGTGAAARLTREGEEQFAEFATRAVRGQLRPGGRLYNLGEDLRDTIGDAWRRMRNLPDIAPPKARAWFDAELRPGASTRLAAVALVDERGARNFHPPVVIQKGEELADRVASEGQVRQALRVDRSGAEVRHALGITPGMTSADPIDLLSRSLAYIGTERLRRTWGFGELKALTSRTAVPERRWKQVLATVEAHKAAALGGLPTPDGDVLRLTPGQQAGAARLIDEVKASALGGTLDAVAPALTSPTRDLSTIAAKDWDALDAHLRDLYAGAGAFRERRAEQASVAGSLRLIHSATDALESKTDLAPVIEGVRSRFSVEIPAERYVNPRMRDALAEFQRQIGGVGAIVKGDVARAAAALRKADPRGVLAAMLNPSYGLVDILKKTSAGIAPEVVDVSELDNLVALSPLIHATSADEIGQSANELHAFFSATPLNAAAAEQMAQEIAGVSVLDRAHRAFERTGDWIAALVSENITEAEANDAMSAVQEGLRRRRDNVEAVGADILVEFAGSHDRAVLAGVNDPAQRSEFCRDAYRYWYTGNWTDILGKLTGPAGNVTGGAKFDQGAAALATLVRLESRRIAANFAQKMAEADLFGDVGEIVKPGLNFDRTYTLGSRPAGREAYIHDVAGYIEAELGWKTTPTVIRQPGQGLPEYIAALGVNTASGVPNPDAYGDAMRIISAWGFRFGKGVEDWKPVDMPGGTRIMVPAMLREPIEDVMSRASPSGIAWRVGSDRLGPIVGAGTAHAATEAARVGSPAWAVAVNAALKAASYGWHYTVGMMKTGLTTGFLIARPAFYVGNFMGGAFQLYEGTGAADALRIITRPVLPTAEGAVIRRVLGRMWADGQGAMGVDVFAPAQRGFWSRTGVWWSDARIAQEATKAGLNSSLAKVELASSLIADIKRFKPDWWSKVSKLPGDWQRFLTEASTGVDNYYRVATFVDGLKRGMTANEAAELARKVAFDYNEMTEFEKETIRPAVMFYSYIRRNQDLFWSTLLTHPDRIVGQVRALRGLQSQMLGNDSDLFMDDYNDDKIPLYFRQAELHGQAANAQRGVALFSPQLPVGAALAPWIDLYGAMHLEAEASGHLGSMLDPRLQMVYVMATGKDVRSGADIDSLDTVPNWLVEMDRNLTGGKLVDNIFQVRQAEWPTGSSEAFPGAPRWRADNNRARCVWKQVIQVPGAGSSMSTIDAMMRSDLGSSVVGGHGLGQWAVDASRRYAEEVGREPVSREPDTEMNRVGVTPGEEMLGFWGIRPTVIDDRQQRINKLVREQQAAVKAETIQTQKAGEHAYR